MKDPSRIARIITAVRAATDRPMTIKIRSGWDNANRNFIEIGKIAESEGVDAITLHPRTRTQGFGGEANWEEIRRLKECVSIPVIGSGDIFSSDDALRMRDETGCDAVMIGRGGYGNPWLIRDSICRLEERQLPPAPTPAERLQVALEHQRLQIEIFGEQKALFEMRKHLCWYARGLSGAAAFRAAINRAESIDEQCDLVHNFFSEQA